MLKRSFLALSLAGASALLIPSAQADAVADLPEKWQTFVSENRLPVTASFEVNDALTGLVISDGQQAEVIYLLTEGDLIFSGELLTLEGDRLTQEHANTYHWNERLDDAIAMLDERDDLWFALGDADAPHIYSFDDLNCPYCHQQYEALKPYVEAGELQVRHVLVATLREDSASLAAKVLSADDPAALFMEYQAAFPQGNAANILNEAAPGDQGDDPRLLETTNLMQTIGITGTPGTLIPHAEATTERHVGMVPMERIEALIKE